MRSTLATAFVALIASQALGEPLPENVAILPTGQAQQTLDQCSRSTPQQASEFWRPDPTEVAEADRRLDAALRERAFRTPELPIPYEPSDYYRQYIGIGSPGSKSLYINLFHRSLFESPEWRDWWREKPVVMCDGGHYFWGITYDTKTKSFGPPRYNGWI